VQRHDVVEVSILQLAQAQPRGLEVAHPSNLESRTADQRIESRIPSAML
jgi:hypothetical protein